METARGSEHHAAKVAHAALLKQHHGMWRLQGARSTILPCCHAAKAACSMLLKRRCGAWRLQGAQSAMLPCCQSGVCHTLLKWHCGVWRLHGARSAMVHGDSKGLRAPCCRSSMRHTAEVAPWCMEAARGSECCAAVLLKWHHSAWRLQGGIFVVLRARERTFTNRMAAG